MNSLSPLRQRLNQNTSQLDDDCKDGYTEFFSWGNDMSGQLGHGSDKDIT